MRLLCRWNWTRAHTLTATVYRVNINTRLEVTNRRAITRSDEILMIQYWREEESQNVQTMSSINCYFSWNCSTRTSIWTLLNIRNKWPLITHRLCLRRRNGIADEEVQPQIVACNLNANGNNGTCGSCVHWTWTTHTQTHTHTPNNYIITSENDCRV